MLKAIIFDFDGLILDTEFAEYESWREIYRSFDLELPVREWAAVMGTGTSTRRSTPYDDLDRQLGRLIDRDAIRSRRREHFAKLMEAEALLPGVMELIDEARRTGVRLAVASSSPRSWVMGYLERLDISQVFECIKCGDDVAMAKPEPDLYFAVLAKLGLTAPEAVALEDSPNGVAAAKAAGLFCVAVPNRMTRLTSLAHADRIVDSLGDVTLASLSEMVFA